MEKIALFDFCGTLANFQTLDPFLGMIICNEGTNCKASFIESKFGRSLYEILLRVPGLKRILPSYKRLLLRMLSGTRRELFERYGEEYYYREVKHNLIEESLCLLRKLKAEGYIIIIVSAGSQFYIKHFAKENHVDGIITAEIEFNNSVATGRFVTECIGKEKIDMLNQYFPGIINELNENIITITDSLSDTPLLDIAKKKIIISHKKHQSWVSNEMEEIIWE